MTKCVLCGLPFNPDHGFATISMECVVHDGLGDTGETIEFSGLVVHLSCVEHIIPIIRENIIDHALQRDQKILEAGL